MQRLIAPLALAAATLAAAPSAHAASDYLLTLDGIKGEGSLAEPFSGTAQHWGWRLPPTPGATVGAWPAFAGGVRLAVGDIGGDGVASFIRLSARDAYTNGPIFFHYELEDVLITSWQTSGAASFEMPRFARATMSWRPLLPNGGRGDVIEGHWDLTNGRFSGDIAVLGALDEMGATRLPDGSLMLTAVPEPASWALMLLGAAGLALRSGLRRRVGDGEASAA